MSKPKKIAQTLITRIPYAEEYDASVLLEAVQNIESRALICLSIPMHVENPFGSIKLINDLVIGGLHLVSLIAWFRDRHVVVSKSRRLTNCWETLAIFSRSADYIIAKDSIRKLKRGFEGKENTFDPEEFLTCQGDHWTVRNDRRDRRFLPATIVLNCGQLADLKPGDMVADPFGNPGVRDACATLGWKYLDTGYPSNIRGIKKSYAEGDKE